MIKFQKNKYNYLIFLFSTLVSISAYGYLLLNGYHLSIEDGRAHLDVARRVFDSLTPGFSQLGGIWLPLPHILMFPLIWNDFMWRTGLAGAIPSMIAFVFSVFFIFKLGKSFFDSNLAGIVAALVFLISPNLLFIQAQPMTESFSMLFFISAIYFYWLWLKGDNITFLFATGICTLFMTLTRYEGWILPIALIFSTILIGIKRKWKRDYIEGKLILLGTLAFFGIFIWCLFNLAIFGNPLNFLHGEGSAAWFANYESMSDRLPARGSLILAAATYLFNMLDVFGIVLCFASILGLVLFFYNYKKIKIENIIVLLILFSPLVFNVYSLFSGTSVMWTKWLDPFKIYNVRYVLLMLPLLALLIAGIGKYKRSIPILIILVVIHIGIFLISGPLILFKDITQTSQSTREVVAKWIRNNPTNGYTLISAGANEIIIFESGQPIKKFIYEGNEKIWNSTLKNPYPNASRIVMGSVLGPQTDKVFTSLSNSKIVSENYELKYSKDNYYIYDIKKSRGEKWEIKSIDTMKKSRDEASRGVELESYRAQLIKIKELGATYVAIDTPYDDEFLPVLKAWSTEAHKMNLKVWYRGNWSAWEGWNNYPKNLTRQKHLIKTKDFIINNPDVFKDGDIFTPCPECEYGGPGSPLNTGDYGGFTNFMIAQYIMNQNAFKQINKDVKTLFSINPDVARAIYTKDILLKTGNTITLDYFVKDVQQLDEGLSFFNDKFPTAKIYIGEFGAPIPDINGYMNEKEQSEFIKEIMELVQSKDYVYGFNYWVHVGGSTALFDDELSSRQATGVVAEYYKLK